MSGQTMFDAKEDNHPQQPSQADLGNDNQSFLKELVGEGKKFSDAEALAKGKFEADRHISSLEEQLKEMREELSKRATAEEIAEKLRNERHTEPVSNASPGISEDRVAEIVKSTVTDLERSRTVRENVMEAQRQFKEVHGDKTEQVLSVKAKELGMTKEQLGEVAGRSPTAFAKLVGLDRQPVANSDQSPVDSDLNQEALKNNPSGPLKEGSRAFWNAKRKELGAKFWEPNIQQQIMKDKFEGRYDA